jgi:hypothetical protein
MHTERFEIAERFCGPPKSGNGGYVCGLMGKGLRGPVAARLKAPPPLGRSLRLERDEGGNRLFDGETLIGEARTASLDLQAPAPPSFDAAREASPAYIGFKYHAFPRCFVCGPQRAPGDGLRLFPGRRSDDTPCAAPWIPDASLADAAGTVRDEFLWAALDCTGGFGVLPVPEGRAIVLGELCASIIGAVSAGEPCVALGWSIGVDGRKRHAASVIYGEDGRPVGLARAVWIEVPAGSWA